jgi:hypothetical protein
LQLVLEIFLFNGDKKGLLADGFLNLYHIRHRLTATNTKNMPKTEIFAIPEISPKENPTVSMAQIIAIIIAIQGVFLKEWTLPNNEGNAFEKLLVRELVISLLAAAVAASLPISSVFFAIPFLF